MEISEVRYLRHRNGQALWMHGQLGVAVLAHQDRVAEASANGFRIKKDFFANGEKSNFCIMKTPEAYS
jgi:hypothetical protein